MSNTIPKIIHYCWFGNGKITKAAQKCIDSWHLFFSDYKFIEWNESNFDVFECQYTAEAYKSKKWAFVSDYVRFKALYDYGGIYFDTDVEVISDFDEIIEAGPFMGFESDDKKIINPGLGMGAVPHMDVFKQILDIYHTLNFVNHDNSLNYKTIVEYTTDVMIKNGLKMTNGIQYVAGVKIYPEEYFSPYNYYTRMLNLTSNTKSIHNYSASWKSGTLKTKESLLRIMGKRNTDLLVKLKHNLWRKQ